MPWMHIDECGISAVRIIQSLVNAGNDTVAATHMDDFINAVKVCAAMKRLTF